MATFAKVNDWILNLHNAPDIEMDTDVLQIALSTTDPTSEGSNPLTDTNGIAANITQISYNNYTDDVTPDRELDSITSVQAAGVYTLNAGDIIITASGGAIASFQWLYLFNQTAATPVDPVIGNWDHGSAIVLADGESATITWNVSGIYTVT